VDTRLHPRGVTEILLAALTEAPIVVLTGPRQSGKSTLVRDMLGQHRPARYVTLDDLTLLEAASVDPQAFVAGLGDGPVVIDEVQLAPNLFRVIKAAVDRDRRHGRFLLTGSADPLLMPVASETLAGRARTVALWPLSQGEIADTAETSIEQLFADGPLRHESTTLERSELISRIVTGGFPEALSFDREDARARWMADYLVRIVERDVPRIADIADRLAVPRLLRVLAARSMQLINVSEIGRMTEIKRATLDRYIALLVASYLVTLLPAWSSGIARRESKRPKPLLADSGLLCHLLRVDKQRLMDNPNALGQILESFVAAELLRQSEWAPGQVRLSHFRTDVAEVDIVLEDAAGRIVGVEVKASSSPTASDFSGLRALAEAAGARFHRGIVLLT
jgi:predicted AAA+ superfamily ATPase